MAIYSDCGLPLKIFVREQNYVENDEKSERKKYLPVKSLAGESAREFYENVISETPASKSGPPVIHYKSANRSSRIRINGRKFNLHKLAQNNEYETLKLVLRDQEICIDAVDEFGWTPLMCAVCNRSIEAVKILLKKKANPNICDKFGNSAFTLARRKNLDIVEIMRKLDSSKSVCEKKPAETIFCDTCKYTFHTDLKTHESSTLHLFNSRPKNPKTFYGIPDCNKGFQLLLKNGWNREKGLGPKECGMKFPVKVTMKNNRIGIGGGSIKHENGMNETNISGKLNKKGLMNQQQREKYFERNYRLQFS